MELRKSVNNEQLRDLANKILSAVEQLSDTEKACKQKFGELAEICSRIRMVEYQIEKLKNSESYQEIEKIVKDRVNELLTNKKVLEHALVSVAEALRNEPDKYLLIDKIPRTYNSLGTMQSILYEGDYQFVKERVLELADKIFLKLQEDIVEKALTTDSELEKELRSIL